MQLGGWLAGSPRGRGTPGSLCESLIHAGRRGGVCHTRADTAPTERQEGGNSDGAAGGGFQAAARSRSDYSCRVSLLNKYKCPASRLRGTRGTHSRHGPRANFNLLRNFCLARCVARRGHRHDGEALLPTWPSTPPSPRPRTANFGGEVWRVSLQGWVGHSAGARVAHPAATARKGER